MADHLLCRLMFVVFLSLGASARFLTASAVALALRWLTFCGSWLLAFEFIRLDWTTACNISACLLILEDMWAIFAQ